MVSHTMESIHSLVVSDNGRHCVQYVKKKNSVKGQFISMSLFFIIVNFFMSKSAILFVVMLQLETASGKEKEVKKDQFCYGYFFTIFHCIFNVFS